MSDYHIGRATGKCSVTDKPFEEGEEFHTVIFEADGGFARRDYSTGAWEGPPAEAICHFKTRMPRKDEAKRTFVDDDVLVNFFLSLEKERDTARQQLRFVLALILLRKRLLKYEQTIREGRHESWRMRLMRDKSPHRVFNPVLSEEQIQSLSEQLSGVLADFATESPDEPDDQPRDGADATENADTEPAAITSAGPACESEGDRT